jgi:(heptosyl)LPS beta-1,4-glucosyltransferase
VKAPVSVVVVTRNEERNIERCLQSVAWAAETIVVDAHSDDGTRNMAAALGARVFDRDWPGFGRQKNFGVTQAANQWVLNVDADEQVTPELASEIIDAIQEQRHVAFRVLIPTYFMGRVLRHYGRAPRDPGHIRLFRKDVAQFDDRLVHEVVEVDGSVGWLRSPILHYSYPTTRTYWQKIHRYAALEAQERAAGSGPRGGRWLRAIGKLGWMLIWRRGLLHGRSAWIWISGQAYQEWLATGQAARLRRQIKARQAPA